MARPIEATPVLKGKDAEACLRQMELNKPVSDSRLRWLEKLAADSKTAENAK